MFREQGKERLPEKSPYSGICRVMTFCGLIAGGLPLLARWWWIADLVANLRVQLLLALMASALIVLLGVGRRQALVLLCVVLWNGMAIHSAFRSDGSAGSPVAKPATGSDAGLSSPAHELDFRVCTNNVLTWNRQHRRIVDSILEARADVVAVIELSTELGDTIEDDLSSEFPHFVSRVNDDGNFGIGLLSKHPIRNHEIFYLCEPLVPSIEADIEISGQMIRVIATHPIPPVSKNAFEARNLHLEMLANRIRAFRTAQPSIPVVLVGDLNLAPWSPHFDLLLSQSGLLNGSSGKGLQPTWYRWNAFPFGLVIDHGLHSRDLICTKRQVLGETGSDHRPVVFEFRR